jgi:hypothetical protein
LDFIGTGPLPVAELPLRALPAVAADDGAAGPLTPVELRSLSGDASEGCGEPPGEAGGRGLDEVAARAECVKGRGCAE